MGALEKKIKEDLADGKMVKRSFGAAKKEYGDRLLLGAMGMVEEGPDKFRVIHDGSHRTARGLETRGG